MRETVIEPVDSKKTLTFDQEGFVLRMTAAGMPEEQAHAQAAILAEIQDDLIQNWLATKNELKRAESRLSREITVSSGSVIFRLGTLVFAGFLLFSIALILRDM